MRGGLEGKTVIVAGASSGMGRAVALAAAGAGADVALLARQPELLHAAAEAVRATAPGRAVTEIAGDASDGDALTAALGPHRVLVDRIDILVNSVGTNVVQRAFGELTATSWAGMLDTNLTAAFNLTRAVIPAMRARGEGLVIHISSMAARRADRSGAAYQAAKAGVVALTHAIMEEERANGIRMTAILPGMTDTPLLNRRPTPPTPEDRARALQPADIAAACLFVMQLPARAHVAEILIQPSRS
jgi:NADP-dependent 3-hydroxy acid dehydrogenase YdfG